jgi:outer membrane protein TolC
MMSYHLSPRTPGTALLLSFLVSLAAAPQEGAAQSPDGAAPPAAAPAAMTLTLQECVQLALQRQPRIAAQRASLAATEDGRRALDGLRLAALVVPELPVRRRQAALGVTAAAAAVDQAEREAVYAVTRTYFTVLYAREQERIARGVVARLAATQKVAQQQLDAGAKGVTDADVRRATVYLRLAKAKQIQAESGVKRALAALKEAVGLGPEACLDVPPDRLPTPDVRPCLGDVVAAALARRGEIVQVTVFAQVTCLEVEAQGTSIHKKMETFAAGSDIHARVVPQGVHNTEYRPGAVPPEMPTLLVGSRPERIQHAQDLHARATAVVEATRNLITLEAEDAFLRWQEAASQLVEARQGADAGEALANDLNKDFTTGQNVAVGEVINTHVLAAQARSEYTQYLYKEILALADLERVTAGGFCAGLVPDITPRPQPAATKDSGK